MFFLDTVNLDVCGEDLIWVIQVLRIVIRVLQIAAPLALILFGSLDFFRAIVSGDEKEMKAKRKPFIGRLISAIIILLLPTLVNLIMRTVAKNTNNTFANCWNAAGEQGWNVNVGTVDDDGNWESES